MLRITRQPLQALSLPALSLGLLGLCVPILGNDLPKYAWLLLLICAGLTVLILHGRARQAVRPRLADAAVLLYLGIACASYFYSANARSTESALLWLAVCLLGYFFARMAATPAALRMGAPILAWAAVLTVLAECFRLLILGNSGYPYIFSTFLNKNDYGAFLASVLPLVFLTPAPAAKESRLGRETLPGMLLIAGIYLTFSRGAWLVAALAAAAAFFCKPAEERRRALPALALALATGLILGLSIDWIANHGMVVQWVASGDRDLFVQKQVGKRIMYWENAWRIFAGAPFIGKGYGTFPSVHLLVARWPFYARYAHNTFLQILAETGLAGLAAFLLAIGAAVAAWLRGEAEDRAIRLPYLLGAGAILMHACFDFTLELPEGALWFWLLLGAGVPSGGEASRDDIRRGWTRFALPAASAALFAIAGILQYRDQAVRGSIAAAKESSDPRQSVALLTRALRIRPRDDEVLTERGLYERRLGQYGAAERDLASAIREDPNKPGYRVNLAVLLLEEGRTGEALRLADRALAANPTLPDIAAGYSSINYLAGRRERAAEVLARAILASGPEAIGMDMPQAAEILAAGLSIPGEAGARVRLSLAWVEFRAAHYDSVRQLLRGLALARPEDVDLYGRLLEGLRSKGYQL